MTTEDDGAEASEYNRRIGARLRDVRRQKAMTLQDVELRSDAEFKASVLGAYERGERAISVPRLERLARFYAVPIDLLFPRDVPTEEHFVDTETPSIVVDLIKLATLLHQHADQLRRYFRMTELERQDYNGKMMSIRSDDRRALAMILDVSIDEVRQALAELGLLYRTPDLTI